MSKINLYSTYLRSRKLIRDSKNVKGSYILSPGFLKSRNRIFTLIEGKLLEGGFSEQEFPTIGLLAELEKEGGFMKGFMRDLFLLQGEGPGRYLRPTSEAIIYPEVVGMMKDSPLPLKIYQVGKVFRKETKETRPLLRSREFHFIEAHTFHASEECSKSTFEGYSYLMKWLAETLRFRRYEISLRPPWDTFPGAEASIALDVDLGSGRFSQAATGHYYGRNFSEAFGLVRNGELAYQTTWGASERLLGILCMDSMEESGEMGEYPPHLLPQDSVVEAMRGIPEGDLSRIIGELGLERPLVTRGRVTRADLGGHWDLGNRAFLRIGPRDVSEGTVSLLLPGKGFSTMSISEAREEILNLPCRRGPGFCGTARREVLCEKHAAELKVLGTPLEGGEGPCSICGSPGRVWIMGHLI